MSTNIVISLDTRRKKMDGSYPVVLRLGHNERTTSIPTEIDLLQKDWDEEKRVVRKSHAATNSVQRLNNQLQKKRNDAIDIITKLDDAGQLNSMTIVDLKKRIVNQNASQSFFSYTQGLIDDLIKANRIGTARSYKGLLSVIKTYTKGRDLQFQHITYDFLTKFEASHYSRGNTANGLSVYIRAIRAIYNKAINSGLAEKELYPFNAYKIKSVPTEKRALDWELLKKIIELDLPGDDTCFNARNYFVASYMMYGMNFTDMAFLRKSDILDGRIRYRRKKTSKLYDIKVTDSLSKILSYYMGKNPDSGYVFPIIRRGLPLEIAKDIQWARKRYNKKLKMLAETCGIKQNLTSYVSRHSFATQAMLLEIPLNAISTMLGHSSLKTTQIYLKSLPTNMLDDYNDKIMQGA